MICPSCGKEVPPTITAHAVAPGNARAQSLTTWNYTNINACNPVPVFPITLDGTDGTYAVSCNDGCAGGLQAFTYITI